MGAGHEKGPGMHWSEAGAHSAAAVRVLQFNEQWGPAINSPTDPDVSYANPNMTGSSSSA
jgi:hypothetical protein